MLTRQANKREENSSKRGSRTLESEAKNKPAVQTRKGLTSRIATSKPYTSRSQNPQPLLGRTLAHQHQPSWTGALSINA